MRAAVFEAPQKLAVVERETPAPGPGELLIRLEGCGVCASDLPEWEGRPWFDYPLPPGKPGHEGWGRIAAVGEGVNGWREGQRVAAFSTAAYADHDLAAAEDVVALPEELDDRPFPGEPLACAINAFGRCNISANTDVAIIGCGFQGLLLMQLAVGVGARVTAITRRESALEHAREAGAEVLIPMREHQQVLHDATKASRSGEGFDCVIEATGFQWPLDVAAELTRIRGQLVIVGYHQEGRQVNMQLWNWRGLDVVNAHERDPRVYVAGMREAVAAVEAGRLRPWHLITHDFPLDDLDQALETGRTRPDGFLKAVLRNG